MRAPVRAYIYYLINATKKCHILRRKHQNPLIFQGEGGEKAMENLFDKEYTNLHNAKLKYYSDNNCQLTAANKSLFSGTVHNRTKPNKRRSDDDSNGDISPPERKRTDSITRAKRKVYDIAYANGDEWKYMVTLTLDGGKIDRYDPNAVLKPFQNWLKNCVKRKGLKALLVAEYHSDKAIHFHGLVNDALKVSDSGTVKVQGYKKPVKLSTAKHYKVKPEEMKTVYNCDDWKLGFSTFVPLDENIDCVCAYVTKYITKDFEKIFGKSFFAVGDIKRDVPTYYADIDKEELAIFTGWNGSDCGIERREALNGELVFFYKRGTLEEVTQLIQDVHFVR